MDLSNRVLTKRIKPDASGWTVAAGTSNVNSDIVDMAGYDAVRFIIGFGAIVSGAVTSVKVQQNDANSGTGMNDLTGSGITVADTDDNKIAISEIIRPQKRYLRLATLRATQNATIDFVLIELYKARSAPLTQDSATVISAELFQTPIEGTA
jgi:hypothetical protein